MGIDREKELWLMGRRMTRLAVFFFWVFCLCLRASGLLQEGGVLLQKQDHSCGREGGARKGNEEEEAGLQHTLHFFFSLYHLILSPPSQSIVSTLPAAGRGNPNAAFDSKSENGRICNPGTMAHFLIRKKKNPENTS